MKLMQVKKLREKCHALGFEGVEIFERFNDNELRIICNGVGPEWLKRKYRKVITWIYKYLEATAFLHDAEFQAQIGFHKANSHFFTNGNIEVRANFKWYSIRRYIGFRRVRQFYWLLETFGMKAIAYGFDMDFVNSIKVEFTKDGYDYDSKLGKYLPIQKKIILYDDRVDAIFPTYCHELTYALQHKHLGLIPYLFALTFLRAKMEKDAREIEDRIYDHIEHAAAQPLI